MKTATTAGKPFYGCGYNVFKKAYTNDDHCISFIQVLNALMKTKTAAEAAAAAAR